MPRIDTHSTAIFHRGVATPPKPALPGIIQSLGAALAGRTAAPMTARELHLSKATDHDDLLRRSREWDVHEARLRSLPMFF